MPISNDRKRDVLTDYPVKQTNTNDRSNRPERVPEQEVRVFEDTVLPKSVRTPCYKKTCTYYWALQPL
jgi:hypothetical protein